MRKVCNLRIPVLCALSLAAGVIFSAVTAYFGSDEALMLVPPLVLFALAALHALIWRRAGKSVIFIVAAVCFLVGAICLYIGYCRFMQNDLIGGRFVGVSGRVDEVGVTSTGRRYVILDRLQFYNKSASGKLIAYIEEGAGGDFCERGYKVFFYAAVGKNKFLDGGEINYRVADGVKYYCSARNIDADYRFSLFAEVDGFIKNLCFNNLDEETASVCYAMLSGNTDFVSGETLSAFRYGGIAHVFAVSGLHIGVIYGALTFLFKKCRLNKYISTVAKLAFITLYSGVCGFSASSVRAVVICSVSALSSCIHRKYDGLNALSLAAIILLVINPWYLFDAGFALSFGAVIGIYLLSHPLGRLLHKLPEKIKSSLSVSLSALFGTMPVSLTTFGYVSAAGLILNVVLIPLISLIFVLIFAVCAISLIVPPVGTYLLPVAALPLQLIINTVVRCGFENAIISGSFSRLLYVPFILITLALTDKFNMRPFAHAALITFVVTGIILSAFKPRRVGVTFYYGFSGGAAVIDGVGGRVLIVTEDYRGWKDDILNGVNDVVILGEGNEFSQLVYLGDNFEKVFIRGSSFPFGSLGRAQLVYKDEFTLNGVSFAFGENSLTAAVDGVNITFSRAEEGETYANLSSATGIHMYLYGDNPAVLSLGEKSYDLSTCGSTNILIKDGEYALNNALPAE